MVLTWKEVGRIMGARGGKQAAANMTPEQRKARASKAIKARWDKYRAAHPVDDSSSASSGQNESENPKA